MHNSLVVSTERVYSSTEKKKKKMESIEAIFSSKNTQLSKDDINPFAIQCSSIIVLGWGHYI
jgi:hypothetical protein